MSERISYAIAELPQVTGIGLTTIKAAIARGDLQVHYPTSKGVVMRSEVEAWVASLSTVSPKRAKKRA